jgi:hypothetical protein
MDGSSLDVSSAYINSGDADNDSIKLYGETLDDHPAVENATVSLVSDSGEEVTKLTFGEFAIIDFFFKTRGGLVSPNVSFPIYDEAGTLMTTIASVGRGISLRRSEGAYSGTIKFGPVNLTPGNYVMVANLHAGSEHIFRSVVARFRMMNSNGRISWGVVDFDQDWQL